MMIEKLLDTIEVNDKDVILMKGDWSQEEIQSLAKLAQIRKMNNILVVIPEEKDMEAMPIDDFYYLLKEVQKNREEKDPTEEKLETAIEALEKLGRLGNGDHYGNSDGNCIAIDCLNKIT